MKIATYTVRVTCDNCRFKGSVSITRGKTVNQQSCPNCGCNRLRVLDGIVSIGGWSPLAPPWQRNRR